MRKYTQLWREPRGKARRQGRAPLLTAPGPSVGLGEIQKEVLV